MTQIDQNTGAAPLRLCRSDSFPETLLDVPAPDLWRHLDGPTLFHLPGRQEPPLFVTALLHGNEHTGWDAMRSVLRQHRDGLLPRSLLLFIGNIEAAKADVRTLPSQTDYNRVWPGAEDLSSPEAALAREVIDAVAAHRPFASIDIHNNTGNNPHYACVTDLAEPFLQLASLFGRTVVYFTRPLGVQSAALSTLCPAVTIECGKVGDASATAHVAEFVSAALALSHFPEHPVPEHDIDLLRTFAIVKTPADASFSFDGSPADLEFRADLDRLNFSELAPGTSFGRLGQDGRRRLEVHPGGEFETTEEYFDYRDGEIILAKPAIPAMLSVDPNAVRLDSVGYLMHRIHRDGSRAS